MILSFFSFLAVLIIPTPSLYLSRGLLFILYIDRGCVSVSQLIPTSVRVTPDPRPHHPSHSLSVKTLLVFPQKRLLPSVLRFLFLSLLKFFRTSSRLGSVQVRKVLAASGRAGNSWVVAFDVSVNCTVQVPSPFLPFPPQADLPRRRAVVSCWRSCNCVWMEWLIPFSVILCRIFVVFPRQEQKMFNTLSVLDGSL